MPASESSAIKVVVRLRPMNDTEKKGGSMPAVTASVEHNTMTIIKGQGMARSVYAFDHVYSAFSTQNEVFKGTLEPVIADVLKGYESTVFAYGQTGTGKTYTMEGSLSAPSQYGIIPRSTEAIFLTLKNSEFESSRVACSFLEIYNEELHDILAPIDTSPKARLEIVNGKNGTFCRGLTEKEVKSSDDVLKVVKLAEKSRKIGETKMNKHSSRSHCIFTVSVYTKRKSPDGTVDYHGKLHLVDLAGSECAKNAGLGRSSNNESTRERERMNINRSLLTLGRVISAVKSRSLGKKTRVPYRDSKLTRMLQEALGGRSKTIIIATLSPSETAISESISTLNYAQTAGGIVNKPVASSYLGGKSQRSGNLGDPADPGNTVEHWFEMECRLKYMEAQVEEAQTALSRQHVHYNVMREKAEKFEEDLITKEEECKEAHRKIYSLEDAVRKEKKRREAIEFHLKLTETSLKKTNAILEATQLNEVQLQGEGTELINKLKQSIADGDDMHSFLLEIRECDEQKRRLTREFHSCTAIVLQEMLSKLGILSEVQEEFHGKVIKGTETGHKQDEESLNVYIELIKDVLSCVANSTGTLKTLSVGEDGVIPTLSDFTRKVNTELSDTENAFSGSSEELSESFQGVRVRLQEYSDYIHMKDTENSRMLDDLLETVESNSAESKNKIIALVSTAIKAASDFQQSSRATRNDLTAVFDQVKESTSVSIKKVEEKAKTQNTTMLNSLAKFSTGMQYHSKMQCELENLGTYMNTEGDNYRDIASSQDDMIAEQKLCFDKTEAKHEMLQAKLITNIVNGVQELINEETKKQTEEMKEQFDYMNVSNVNLLRMNGNINRSVTDIFSQVGCTNTTLTEHVKVVQENDDTMKIAAEDATQTLDSIQNIARENQDSLESFEERVGVTLATFDDHDESLAQATIAVEEQRDDVAEYITGTALECTRDGLSELGERERKQTNYVTTTIISNTGKDMETTQSVCKDSFANISERLEQLKNVTQQGKSALESIVEQQCVTSDNLNQLVNSKGSDFITNGATKRELEIDERRNTMNKHVEHQAEIVLTRLSETENCTAEAENKILTFGKDVICMNEEVLPVEDRKIIEFKNSLSSTPSSYQIIESIDMHLMDDEDSYSYHNSDVDDDTEENAFPYKTKEDNAKPMSPLSEVSINSNPQAQHFAY